MKFVPPTLPFFGTGAPGAGVPHFAMYFDTSTSPFTPYIYHGGWVEFGGSFSADHIQGIPVTATVPTDKQTLVYNSGANHYAPGAV